MFCYFVLVCISLDAFHFVLTGFANEYRPMLQSSLQQLVVQCTSLLHILLPQEDKGNPPEVRGTLQETETHSEGQCTICTSSVPAVLWVP